MTEFAVLSNAPEPFCRNSSPRRDRSDVSSACLNRFTELVCRAKIGMRASEDQCGDEISSRGEAWAFSMRDPLKVFIWRWERTFERREERGGIHQDFAVNKRSTKYRLQLLRPWDTSRRRMRYMIRMLVFTKSGMLMRTSMHQTYELSEVYPSKRLSAIQW
jgi:hypothetical protein